MIIYIDRRQYVFDVGSEAGRWAFALFRVREELQEYWRLGERERVAGYLRVLRGLRQKFFSALYSEVPRLQVTLEAGLVMVTV